MCLVIGDRVRIREFSSRIVFDFRLPIQTTNLLGSAVATPVALEDFVDFADLQIVADGVVSGSCRLPLLIVDSPAVYFNSRWESEQEHLPACGGTDLSGEHVAEIICRPGTLHGRRNERGDLFQQSCRLRHHPRRFRRRRGW